MLIIDGSYGEGGGQIVRTAVALSVVFNTPVKVVNIRKGRSKPGLKVQHLSAIKALAELTNSRVNGLVLGGDFIEFFPGGLINDSVNVDISTSGSVGLCLQCLITALIRTPRVVTLNFNGGGTCGLGSPSLDYLINVWFPNMTRFGFSIPEVIVRREGFYPKGGALVTVRVFPSRIKPYSFIKRGDLVGFKGVSKVSLSLKSRMVAERQAVKAEELYGCPKGRASVTRVYSPSFSPGSSLTVWAEYSNSVIGADAIGAIGKSSEQVAIETLSKLENELSSEAVIDSHCADMLIPLMAIAGSGELITNKVTNHSLTNAWLCSQFISKEFKIKNNKISL